MKKAATLLMASMLAVSLVACGGSGDSEVQKPTEVSTSANEQPEEATDEEAPESEEAAPVIMAIRSMDDARHY